MQNSSYDYCYLDKIRLENGIDKCKAVFLEAHTKNTGEAANLLKDPRLTFPCLFILVPQIESLQMERYLDYRNITALNIINQIQKKEKYNIGVDYLSSQDGTVYPILKWILETGHTEDCLNNEYEEIMDITVSILINIYNDKSTLPTVADMIYKRNKKGHLIHDLAWAFFQIQDPDALKLIAERMCSSDRQDVELSCQLLNIDMASISGADADKRKQAYLQWLVENDKFLYFTGESFQLSSSPVLCRVDLERKYLNKGTESYSRQPVVSVAENEKKYLEDFKALREEEKKLLSEYSYKIHSKNISEWKEWMNTSISNQIKTARADGGGRK